MYLPVRSLQPHLIIVWKDYLFSFYIHDGSQNFVEKDCYSEGVKLA